MGERRMLMSPSLQFNLGPVQCAWHGGQLQTSHRVLTNEEPQLAKAAVGQQLLSCR